MQFQFLFFSDDEPKTELGKKLREHLDDILEKIKDAIENGKAVKEEWVVKVREYLVKVKYFSKSIAKTTPSLWYLSVSISGHMFVYMYAYLSCMQIHMVASNSPQFAEEFFDIPRKILSILKFPLSNSLGANQ